MTYRPPGVHHSSRRITQALARVASSPLSSVAAPPSAPSPQAHLDNVSDAIAFLATCPLQPPRIVMHPWEGHTTSSVLEVLGGRPPRVLPRPPAQVLISGAWVLARAVPALAANVRRAEMLWFGQDCDHSWLESQGWAAPAGAEAWHRLASEVRAQFSLSNTNKKLGRTHS